MPLLADLVHPPYPVNQLPGFRIDVGRPAAFDALGDIQARGFLVGGTAGRTTLNGEGLQHQDGHSHLLAYPVPNLVTYDPAYAYELAVIVRDGIRRMYQEQENIFYYLTVYNENYEMAPMPVR